MSSTAGQVIKCRGLCFYLSLIFMEFVDAHIVSLLALFYFNVAHYVKHSHDLDVQFLYSQTQTGFFSVWCLFICNYVHIRLLSFNSLSCFDQLVEISYGVKLILTQINSCAYWLRFFFFGIQFHICLFIHSFCFPMLHYFNNASILKIILWL